MAKKNGSKIMIVEDDPFISDIYLVELENNGYEVDIANNGQEGLDKLKDKKFDLILLDILMPQKDGLTVLKELRANPEQKKTKVIMLTNLAGKEHIKKALDSGANDYIVKTQFTPQEVLEKINQILKEV